MEKIASTAITVLLLVGFLFLLTPLAFGDSEDLYPFENTTEELGPGFGNASNKYAWSMQDYNGYMYVGTNSLSFDFIDAISSGALNDIDIDSMDPKYPLASLVGMLGSTYDSESYDPADVWRYDYDTQTWEQETTPDNIGGFRNMAVLDGTLYADALDAETQTAVLAVSDGEGNWTTVDPPFDCFSMRGMVADGDYLYVGTDNGLMPGYEDSSIYRYSKAGGWEWVTDMDEAVEELIVHNGTLYAGTVYNTDADQGGLYEIDVDRNATTFVAPDVKDTAAATLVGPDVKDTTASVFELYSFNDTLYMGTANYIDGFEFWSITDGGEWEAITTDGFGDSDNIYTWSMADFDGTLYMGTFTSSLFDAVNMDSLDLTMLSGIFGTAELWALEEDAWGQIALPSIEDGFGIWDYGIRNMEVGDNSLWLGTASNIIAPDFDALVEYLLANFGAENIPDWFLEEWCLGDSDVQSFIASFIQPGTEIWRSQPVPEPATLALLGLGLLSLAGYRKKRSKRL